MIVSSMTGTPCLDAFLGAVFAAAFSGRFFGVARFDVFFRAGLALAFRRFERESALARVALIGNGSIFYFIKQTMVTEEAIHFHELIHVIQWRLLGPEAFLATYANGLDDFGYENSPLEKMAYDAEAAFKRSCPIFDAEKFVAEWLGRLR